MDDGGVPRGCALAAIAARSRSDASSPEDARLHVEAHRAQPLDHLLGDVLVEVDDDVPDVLVGAEELREDVGADVREQVVDL